MALQSNRLHNQRLSNVFRDMHEHVPNGRYICGQIFQHQKANASAPHARWQAAACRARLRFARIVLELNAAHRLIALLTRALEDLVCGGVGRAIPFSDQLQHVRVRVRLRHATRDHCALQRQSSHLARHHTQQKHRRQVQVQGRSKGQHNISRSVNFNNN